MDRSGSIERVLSPGQAFIRWYTPAVPATGATNLWVFRLYLLLLIAAFNRQRVKKVGLPVVKVAIFLTLLRGLWPSRCQEIPRLARLQKEKDMDRGRGLGSVWSLFVLFLYHCLSIYFLCVYVGDRVAGP